jgi:hypothetical protein
VPWSLDGSVTRIPFGLSAVDDAERDEVRAGCRFRFALAETGGFDGRLKVARLVVT